MRETVGSESRAGDLTVAGDVSGTIAQSQVTDLTTDLAAKSPLASPTFTGTVEAADIEVSGGVFLGGTAAANKLDDYEEGTWTPTYTTTGTDFTSITYDAITTGFYTKIGQRVFFSCVLRTDAVTVGSASGNLRVTGLPFTVRDTAAGDSSAVSVGFVTSFVTNHPDAGNAVRATTDISLYYRSSSNGTPVTLPFSALNTGANDNDLYLSGHYIAA